MPSKTNGVANANAGRYSTVGGRSGGSAVRALEGCAEVLAECVTALVGRGDALFIGTVRDGSAVLLRVYSESGNGEWYEGSSSGLISTLYAITEAAKAT